MGNTETPDPRFVDIDDWPTGDAVAAMLGGQRNAAAAVASQVRAIADAADAAAPRLRAGGRLVLAGAGTSGRVAVQDGVELTPTFNWPRDRVVFLLAGGMTALSVSVEGAEDDADDGRRQVVAAGIVPNDVVIGTAASGRTPFTVAVIDAARAAGALTIGLASNAGTALLAAAEHPLLVETGSEVIAGSTRMQAGTAQKIVLNLLSTAIMLRLGRVYRGLLVDMVISNDKLRQRAIGMVRTLTSCDADAATAAIVAAGDDIKAAVLIARGLTPETAHDLLGRNDGILRGAIEELERRTR